MNITEQIPRSTNQFIVMKQWYEELFENYAVQYDDESYTKGTSGECDFIESEIGYDKKIKIIDIG